MAQEGGPDSLEERLRSHAESFNGLLSLIPAKYYYGEDTSDQWRRKKQTKEEARAAKRAKLDPDNAKSAKDVLDEQAANAEKRRREEEGETSEVEGVEAEEPISVLAKKGKQTKKQKREEIGIVSAGLVQNQRHDSNANPNGPEVNPSRNAKAGKRKEGRESKKAKATATLAKRKAKEERKIQRAALEEDFGAAAKIARVDDEEDADGDDIDLVDIDGIAEERLDRASSTATTSTMPSPAFDASANHSGSSSISSIVPTSKEDMPSPRPVSQNPTSKPSAEELKARLAKRIDDLRRSRHADGVDGAPARNRQELMEARRAKEEQRRAHKKELRRKAKEEEQRKKNETLTRGSPLLSNSPLLSPGSPFSAALEPAVMSNNFSFGRVQFSDGACATPSLNSLVAPKTQSQKGPSDPRTALIAAQSRQSRLSALNDDAKRADIADKDTWNNAKKRARGEVVRDDASLLKKTLKRKEKLKKRSEREWGDRIEGLKKGVEVRQKKREANLAKRREEKGGAGRSGSGGGKKGKNKGNMNKKKARPGFEGTFRAKAPKVGKAEGAGGRRR